MREHGYYAVTPTNRLALVSMVFGIVSYGLVPLIGGVVAVLTGHMALSQIQRTREAGEGCARAGLVLGYLNIALTVVIVALVLSAFAILAWTFPPSVEREIQNAGKA